MKLLRRPIAVIASFDPDGNTKPVRFKLINEDEEDIVIKVEKIIKRDMDKFAGNKMLKYTCESCINGEQRLFELSYELDTCKWYLYKL